MRGAKSRDLIPMTLWVAALATALVQLNCASQMPIPSQWSTQSPERPVETDRALFQATPDEVRMAIERVLVSRGYQVGKQEPPYQLVAFEIEDCPLPAVHEQRAPQGACLPRTGWAPTCRRVGIAATITPQGTSTLVRIYVRIVDANNDADCIPSPNDDRARLEVLDEQRGTRRRYLLESVRERLELK